MKKVLIMILAIAMLLSVSTITAHAESEEEYPYIGRSTDTLAFRDEYGNYITNLWKGNLVRVLYRDPRDSDRVWVSWDGMEGSIIERCIEKIDQEVDLTYSQDAYLTTALNLRVPETYEWIELLEAGTKVTVLGEDLYNYGRTVIRWGDYEGSVLSNSIMKVNAADFILVDIEKQMVFLYKSGLMVACDDVVTGMLGSKDTPRGVFSIQYMKEAETLTGEDYSVDVCNWMPFYDGCGFHSSTRDSFGGDIYTYNGSHGCVNCTLEFSSILYANSYPGMTVVIP